MNKTKIEWVKNPDGTQGYTWNPITGCLNGCEYCYARKLANGRLKQGYLHGGEFSLSPSYHDRYPGCLLDPFYPRFWPERLNQPIRGYHKADWSGITPDAARAKGIFTCDMSDLFGIGIPLNWTQQVMDTIKKCPQDRFYLLTKQPQNLIKFSPFPGNCWVGVTVTDMAMFYQAVKHLGQVKAAIKFISFEPLLESIYIPQTFRLSILAGWLIIGAQTKPYKPPRIEWVEEIVNAADKAGIPVFIKNNLAAYASNLAIYPNMRVGDNGWDELRKEMPGVK